MNSDAIECLCLEISTKTSGNIILSLKYRRPNCDTTLFEKHMKSILSKNEATEKEVILIGDFNISLLDFDKNKRVQSFLNLMFQFGMIPTINKPTRVTRDSSQFTLLLQLITYLQIQWNLLIADILSSGHLSTANTFLGNGWNPGQTLITKPLCSRHFIADTILRSQLNFCPMTDK